jgi:hypothetical protein
MDGATVDGKILQPSVCCLELCLEFDDRESQMPRRRARPAAAGART